MHWFVMKADHLLGPQCDHGEGFAAFIREFHFVDIGRPTLDYRPYLATHQAVLRKVFEQRNHGVQLNTQHHNHHTIGSLMDGPRS